jgi:hypothetical protein
MSATAVRKKPEHDSDSPRTPLSRTPFDGRASVNTADTSYAPSSYKPLPSSTTSSLATRRSRAVAGAAPARRLSPPGRAQRSPLRRDLRDAGDPAALADDADRKPGRGPYVSPGEYTDSGEIPNQVRPRVASRRAARRALRRSHRPFRLSPALGVASGLVLLQLVALLWLKGLALTARNRADVLDRKITAISGEIANTEDTVAKLSSPPQLRQWAEELGMRPATQADIDDVRQRTPWSPPSRAAGSSPTSTSAEDTFATNTPGADGVDAGVAEAHVASGRMPDDATGATRRGGDKR